MVAQALTLAEPNLVRRLILVGTGPRGGEGASTTRAGGPGRIRRRLREPGRGMAGRLLHPVRGKPGRRPGVSESGVSACARTIATRRPTRRWRRRNSAQSQIGARRAARPGLPPKDHPANVGDQRQQRCDRLHREFVHSSAESAQARARPLSGCQSGSRYPVPHVVVADVAQFLDAEAPFPTPGFPGISLSRFWDRAPTRADAAPRSARGTSGRLGRRPGRPHPAWPRRDRTEPRGRRYPVRRLVAEIAGGERDPVFQLVPSVRGTEVEIRKPTRSGELSGCCPAAVHSARYGHRFHRGLGQNRRGRGDRGSRQGSPRP